MVENTIDEGHEIDKNDGGQSLSQNNDPLVKILNDGHQQERVALKFDMNAMLTEEEDEGQPEDLVTKEVEVYVPEMPWQSDAFENDPYEEFQKYMQDEDFGHYLQDKYSIENCDCEDQMGDQEIVIGRTQDVDSTNRDLNARKSTRKRKATSN
ncbi:hypothetical protein L7F22_000627 [Adiantum nelumboides]|nr:hypothetical protein [Adiantum nelumboides]